MSHKRYLLFAGDDYYPGGGIRDYVGAYETPTLAQRAFKMLDAPAEWAQIVEYRSGSFVPLLYFPKPLRRKKIWCRWDEVWPE